MLGQTENSACLNLLVLAFEYHDQAKCRGPECTETSLETTEVNYPTHDRTLGVNLEETSDLPRPQINTRHLGISIQCQMEQDGVHIRC